jgi:hypothetical protein
MVEALVVNASENEPLYRHTKRSEWGLAILAWEQPNKRGYQFQDGVLRIINEGFYDLLCQVEHPPDGAEELIADLKQKAGLAGEKEKQKSRVKDGITFSDQLQIFRIKYPQGFEDEGWRSSIRGVGPSRRLKRHRQPAIEEAQAALANEALGAALAEGRSAEIVETVAKLLKQTNLVKPKELDPLDRLGNGQQDPYVTALRAVLHGDGPLDQRFDHFSGSHGKKTNWPLVTAPLALVQPATMLCVHPTTIRRQARVLEPALSIGAQPRGRVYERLLALAGRIRDLLVEASLTPADLMDVFDFMGVTLLPSARQLLKE